MRKFVNYVSFRSFPGLIVATLLVAGCVSPNPAPIRQSTPVPPSSTPQTTPPAGQPSSAGRTHVVRPGDTLMAIGRMYGQSVNDLVAWNGLANPNQISVGQTIRVSPSGAAGSQTGPVATTRPVEVIPVVPPAAGVVEAPIKQEPRGGTQPYSDQAWAAVRPQDATNTPAVPTTPAAPPPSAAAGAWLWPASGAMLESFNEATNKGIDIAGKPGDPVIASAAGKVVYAGSGLRGYGKLVIIKHDDDYLSAYAHNQQLLVKEGDSVTKGQKVAELGSTDADRPKLHFEIRRKGRPVDPMQYLPAR